MKKFLAMLLAVVMVLSMAACADNEPENTTPGTTTAPAETTPGETEPPVVQFEGDYIWKSAASALATNWNPHTYQTTDDGVPADYQSVGLYSFIFNDELHPVEGKDLYAGYVVVPEMAESMPVDVTEAIKASNPEFGIPADATSGYAYTIDLNKAACWDDGTPINAETYVESFKRLLDGRFLNYRAADYIDQTLSIVGTGDYFYSGRSVYLASNAVHEVYSADLDAELIFSLGAPTSDFGAECAMRPMFGFPSSYDAAACAAYIATNYLPGSAFTVEAAAAMEGKTLAEIKADATMNAAWEALLGWWQTEPNEELHFFLSSSTYPEFGWEGVGLFASGEYQLTVVLDKSLAGFDLIYNISGLTDPLVKIDLYDACLKEETGASGKSVWSSTYNTSVETNASYGPYKMSSFQSSKAMHFVKNDKWYGYTDGKHVYVDPTDGKTYPMYQTTEVDIQVVPESSTMKLMFMSGQLMGYGLQAEDYASLRNSEYCYVTPAETIFFLILNGNMQAIIDRESAENFDKTKNDLEMLTNKAFHQAIGLCYDKDDFAATISPARSGALGIFGTGYIYDPDTGAQYRDSDAAKQVLCDFYGVDATKFASLDEAVDSITGYDPEQAKVFFKQAFDEGIAAGYITDADNDGKCDQTISIEYAMGSEVNDFMTQTIKYMNDHVAEVATGTPFEGKIEFYMSANYGNDWSNKIKQGQSDTVLGGWTGSLLDPFGLTDLYTNPSKQYDAAWYDATTVELTINVPVNGEKKDVTMTLKQWSDALNGTAVTVNGVEYNYGSGQADIDVRLDILAACEGKILESYNYLPMLQDGSMALLTQQCYYVVEEYNPIMGRGGIAYTKYNYNETEWAKYVADQGGELKY